MRARRKAGAQMKLSKRTWEARLPAECPWSLSQVLETDFWPETETKTNGRS
jgi:hypothetical protein